MEEDNKALDKLNDIEDNLINKINSIDEVKQLTDMQNPSENTDIEIIKWFINKCSISDDFS